MYSGSSDAIDGASLGTLAATTDGAGHDQAQGIYNHMLHEHGRDPLDLLRSPECLAALHRFEHFEADSGLVTVTHTHRFPLARTVEHRERGTWSR